MYNRDWDNRYAVIKSHNKYYNEETVIGALFNTTRTHWVGDISKAKIFDAQEPWGVGFKTMHDKATKIAARFGPCAEVIPVLLRTINDQ
jgi:hypothetical protein